MRYVNRDDYFRDAIRCATDVEDPQPSWSESCISKPMDRRKTAQEAIDIYPQREKADGSMDGVGWWQCANGYTAIILKDIWSRDRSNYDELDRLLRKCETNNSEVSFINAWNDDSCWWALCCVHMFNDKDDQFYLDQAQIIWRHVRKSMLDPGEQTFRGVDMEGAVYWTTRPGEDHINAISTGLFAELSVRLALALQEVKCCGTPSVEEYIDTARRGLGWILRCRYNAGESMVLDHIELKAQKAIDWTFTYNTGVALGTAALMYQATGEEEYMTIACSMAHKAMTREFWVEENGVLTESGAYGKGKHDPLKNNDAVGFKSVLIRQLCTLYTVVINAKHASSRAKETAATIHTFIHINYQSQVERNTDGKATYGPWWNGPFEYPTSHSQMAALDVMAAAVLLEPS